jgi:predicted RNase H-like HicB family nuclease
MERNMEYTAIIKKTENWWIGWIEEIPGVNCQEETREDLLQSLKQTLTEAIEFNKNDAREAAGANYKEEIIAV